MCVLWPFSFGPAAGWVAGGLVVAGSLISYVVGFIQRRRQGK